MARYAVAPGLRLEPLGERWVAFSALSGETLMLNDEAAAMLEALAEGPRSSAEVAELLATDGAGDAAALLPVIDAAWSSLITDGLVRPA